MSDDVEMKASEKLATRIKRSLEVDKKELLGEGRSRNKTAVVEIDDDPFAKGDSIAKNLHKALRVNEGTNQHGEAASAALGTQRETIQRSLNSVDETNENLRGGKRAIREMKMALWKERIIKGAILLMLVLLIIFIVYEKWVKKKQGKTT
jgi:hypothetical protein